MLKANKSSAETPGTGRLRNVLVVGQFAVSIGLIICTAVVYAQTVYARTVDPGYKRDHILQVDELSRYQLLGKGRGDRRADQARARRAGGRPHDDRRRHRQQEQYRRAWFPGRTEPVTIGIYQVDDGFLDAMGLKLVAGRWFDDARPMDDMTLPYPARHDAPQRALAARGGNIVINELAAKRLGFNDPAEAVGKTFGAALVDNEIGPGAGRRSSAWSRTRASARSRQPLDPIMFQNAQSGHTAT